MNYMRISTVRVLVAASIALGGLASAPDRGFAEPDCNLNRDLAGADLSRC